MAQDEDLFGQPGDRRSGSQGGSDEGGEKLS